MNLPPRFAVNFLPELGALLLMETVLHKKKNVHLSVKNCLIGLDGVCFWDVSTGFPHCRRKVCSDLSPFFALDCMAFKNCDYHGGFCVSK